MLQYDRGQPKYSFIMNHLGCMSGKLRAANECGKIRYLYMSS